MIVAAALSGIVLVGFNAWAEVATTVADAVVALAGVVGGVTLLLVVVNLAKEKFGMALVGLLVPVAATGAVRLAKPHSLWARLYGDEKAARAEARYGRESAPA